MSVVLAVAAHPDDETSAGGLLAKYANEGHNVYILMTTRGEGGTCGDPPICERHELGQVREAEARAAAEILDARQVIFLPYVDPEFRDGELQRVAATLEEFSESIKAVIDQHRPDIIITHGSNGDYGHPQHIFTYQAVFQALRQLQPWKPAMVLTWCAAFPDSEISVSLNQDDPADWLVDISPWADRKLAAFQAHRTQFESVVRYYCEQNSHFMEEKVESYRRWPEYERSADSQSSD